MKKLKIELENCYGIRKLEYEFDFSNSNAVAIYAPNGSMKSSFAKTFFDISRGADSKDLIFKERETIRKVTDENGAELKPANVLVIEPYAEKFGDLERTSILLVNTELRTEYESLQQDAKGTKEQLIRALRKLSGAKRTRDIEKEISRTFTNDDNQLNEALEQIHDEIINKTEAPFAEIMYEEIFQEEILDELEKQDIKLAIQDYINKYNELLEASTYFTKGIFTHYNAAAIAKSLEDHGFFKAKHSIKLNAGEKKEISNKIELEKLIEKEQNEIITNPELRSRYLEIDRIMTKKKSFLNFQKYLSENENILPHLENIEQFKEDVWKSYLIKEIDLYKEYMRKYQQASEQMKRIEDKARNEQRKWDEVINIFNDRFLVPFRLSMKNRIQVTLGQEPIPLLEFTFQDGEDSTSIERDSLVKTLSTGEKKALYILDILFEIQTLIESKQETLLIIDDIADSFDYANKYAIIQYLKEISEEDIFKKIILTHNFDFFRTINSRYVISYSNCLMANKSDQEIELTKATGINNIFINDWKKEFSEDAAKRIASIPFIRNLIEYKEGQQGEQYKLLTSLLHLKNDSEEVTQGKLFDIYNKFFQKEKAPENSSESVLSEIYGTAEQIISEGPLGINLENKVVLSIAIRLCAEKFMIEKISDPDFVESIKFNQTSELLKRYRKVFPECSHIQTLDRVILMTPENIHLNSFMYEPILDMSDHHLRRLYQDVSELKASE